MKVLSVIFTFILAGTLCAQNKINRYEYWFDNAYASRSPNFVSPAQNLNLNTTFSASSLTPGLHVMHIRFCDDNTRWSSVLSQFFFRIPPATASVSVIGYEYWFDNNYAGRIYSSISPQQNVSINTTLNGNLLTEGLHTVHVRFVDSEGIWSSAISQFFFRNPVNSNTTHEINAYQFWYDNNFSTATTTTVGPGQNITLFASLNTSNLSLGLHTIHVRFRENSGQWSSVVSQFFFRNQTMTSAAINIYQYWYDSNYSAAITQSVAPQQNVTINTNLPSASLNNGLHVIHIRFRDTTGKWSSVVSQFFHMYEQTPGTNPMIMYRYWFDQIDSSMIQTSLVASQNATVNTSISMTTIPQGTHTVHFQFSDSLGRWSSATTDTIQKLTLPISMFSTNDTIFCDSGTVAFMDHSIDADQFLWYFGDGDSSTFQYPTHNYALPGLYTVELTVTDSASGLDTSSTRVQYIRIYSTPSRALVISPNDSVCSGQTTIITADSNAVYSWNTSANTQSVTVNSDGDYWATVSNAIFPACSTNTDTVHITVLELPIVDLGSDTTICEGNQLLLDVTGAGATYNWSTGSNLATINVNNAGAYWVTVTTSFGCQNSDTVAVGIDSITVAAFSYSANGTLVSYTDNSSYATTWNWDFGDGNYSTQQNPSNTYSAPGTYTVTLITTNGCGSDTITDIILVSGIVQSGSSSTNLLYVYPNPANELVNMMYAVHEGGNITITILSVNGDVIAPVLTFVAPAGSIQTATLDVNGLANGTYIVRLISGVEISMARFIIAH